MAPSRADADDTFVAKANALVAWYAPFVLWLKGFITWFGTFKTEAEALQADVTAKAGNTAENAAIAAGAAAAAVASAASAAGAPGTSATSATPLTLTAGTKAVALQQTGKAIGPSVYVLIADRADPTNRQMQGAVAAADPVAGTLSVVVQAGNVLGAGGGSDWLVSVVPTPFSTPAIAAATVAAVQPGLADLVAMYAYFLN